MQSQLLINGALVEGKGERLPVYNPATGEVLLEIAEASPEQVDAAVKRKADITIVRVESPISYFSINSIYLSNFEFENGKCMNLDGVLIVNLPLRSINEAATALGCSSYIFDLSVVFTELF